MLAEKVYIFHANRKKSREARQKQNNITKYGIKKYAQIIKMVFQ